MAYRGVTVKDVCGVVGVIKESLLKPFKGDG